MLNKNKSGDLLIFLAIVLNLLGFFAITIAMDPSRTGPALIVLLIGWCCITQVWRFVSKIQSPIHKKWRRISDIIIRFNKIEIRKYIIIIICYFATWLSKLYVGTDAEMFTTFLAALSYLAACLVVIFCMISQAKISIFLSKQLAVWLYRQIKYMNS